MKISFPRLEVRDRQIQLSAEVQGFAQPLWFRFDRALEKQITLSADPFVVSLLLLAMLRNEPLVSEAPVSKKLLEGLGSFQRIFHEWFPERFSIIEIQAEICARTASNGGEASAFSGGVDSFYTFKKLEPGLSGALFMAGFDMPLNLKTSIAELTESYSGMMGEKSIPFVAGSTNIREFLNPVDWTNAHGPALAASALFFQQQWKRFYIPSSYREGASPRWGTHPSLDPLLSTESMEFVHHGAEANRVKKLETLIQAPETFERLRVCWIQDIGLKNCGECEKCVRTMVALGILGALQYYKTFASPLTREKVRALKMRTYQSRLFARELIGEAVRRGELSIAADLGIALLRRGIFRLTRH